MSLGKSIKQNGGPEIDAAPRHRLRGAPPLSPANVYTFSMKSSAWAPLLRTMPGPPMMLGLIEIVLEKSVARCRLSLVLRDDNSAVDMLERLSTVSASFQEVWEGATTPWYMLSNLRHKLPQQPWWPRTPTTLVRALVIGYQPFTRQHSRSTGGRVEWSARIHSSRLFGHLR